MSGTKEKTVNTSCPECDIGPFTRNHYFTGKLLVERDFRQEQAYYMDKLRLHTQRLHGWGVVCGLKVKQHETCPDRFVCIEPGLAIDCCGHDIFVPEEDCIDFTQFDSVKALLAKKDGQPHILQIRICYKECPSEPIPVLYDDCGCDDTQCAPNRILESYEVDVAVDPDTTASSPEAPSLAWKNSIDVAHASQVALHDATHRIYVLTKDSPGTIYQVSTDNFTIVTSHPLGDQGLGLAVSNSGDHVYVVTGDPTVDAPLQLHVLDATSANLPLVQKKPIPIAATAKARSGIVLAVAPAPDNSLMALITATGDLLKWDSTIDSDPKQPAPPKTIASLKAKQNSLVLSSDGSTAYVAGAQIQAVHLADGTIKAINVPAVATPIALAIVNTAAGNWLAVADANANANQLHLVDPVAQKVVGTAPLANLPVGLAVAPDGRWAYVVEQDAGANKSYVEPVDLAGLQNGQQVKATPLEVGTNSQSPVLAPSGQTLLVPFTGDMTKASDGGVAIVEVSETACCDMVWKSLEGCPSCCTANCVVLATITGYVANNTIEDLPSESDDGPNHISRVDNHAGRRLLPSTSTLADMIQCICDAGSGGQGKKGDTGPQGPQNPGPGLEQGLTRINGLSWIHNELRFVQDLLNFPDPLNSARSVPGIVISFTAPVQFNVPVPNLPKVLQPIDTNIFEVLIQDTLGQDTSRNSPLLCRCPVRGIVIPVDHIDMKGPPNLITGASQALSGNVPVPGIAFLFTAGLPKLGGSPMWIQLRCDFVVDQNGKAVDGAFLRMQLPTGDHMGALSTPPNPNPLGLQGGLFESWFRLGD
jgi:DNA-binding beta-propeller fold protein YncE